MSPWCSSEGGSRGVDRKVEEEAHSQGRKSNGASANIMEAENAIASSSPLVQGIPVSVYVRCQVGSLEG